MEENTKEKEFNTFTSWRHWQLHFYEEINQKIVSFALELNRNYNPNILDLINLKNDHGTYHINGVCITGFSEKAVIFTKLKLFEIIFSHYPIVFSVPNSHVIKYDTDRAFEPQNITISKWAGEHCYYASIRKTIEDFGFDILGLLNSDSDSPMYKYSPYYEILNTLHRLNKNSNKNQREKMKTALNMREDKILENFNDKNTYISLNKNGKVILDDG